MALQAPPQQPDPMGQVCSHASLWLGSEETSTQAPKLVSVPGLDSDEITQSAEVCGPDGTCAVPQP